MFLRKLLVVILPLALCAALSVGMPLITGLGFFTQVLRGVLLGGGLSLILPLCGASRRRETFGRLLWVPAVTLLVVLLYQYLTSAGMLFIPALTFLATNQPNTVLIESAMLAYLAGHLIRWK